MKLGNQILLHILCLALSFFFLRCFLSGMKSYQLNKNALKKKKKGETFVQWLLYSKFKEEIPFGWRLFYYFICLIHLLGILFCISLYVINREISPLIGRRFSIGLVHFDIVWNFVVYFAFYSRNPLHPVKYERWIKKKRGMNKTYTTKKR